LSGNISGGVGLSRNISSGVGSDVSSDVGSVVSLGSGISRDQSLVGCIDLSLAASSSLFSGNLSIFFLFLFFNLSLLLGISLLLSFFLNWNIGLIIDFLLVLNVKNDLWWDWLVRWVWSDVLHAFLVTVWRVFFISIEVRFVMVIEVPCMITDHVWNDLGISLNSVTIECLLD